MDHKLELKKRLNRFINGKFEVDDLNKIFLYLRENSSRFPTVRDIGDMIAHKDKRKQGIIVESMSDIYFNQKFHILAMNKKISWNNLPENFMSFIKSSVKLSHESEALKNKKREKIRDFELIESISKKTIKENGKLIIKFNELSTEERGLLEFFTKMMFSRPAYNSNKLFDEFQDCLKEKDLIDEKLIEKLKIKKDYITLFVISALHGVKLIMPDRTEALAIAGAHEDKSGNYTLGVYFTFNEVVTIFNGQELEKTFCSPMFMSELEASKYFPKFSELDLMFFDHPVEVVDGPMLSSI